MDYQERTKHKDRPDPFFHLPQSALEKIQSVIKAYFTLDKAVRLEDVVSESHGNRIAISLMHGFLIDIGILEGGTYVKHLTQRGKDLGSAIKFGTKKEIKEGWYKIIKENQFCIQLLNDIYSKGKISIQEFRKQVFKHAKYTDPSADFEVGINALINIFLLAGYVTFTNGYYRVSKIIENNDYLIQSDYEDETKNFISGKHISELEQIRIDHRSRFDLSRLNRYCQEINDNFPKGNYSSVIILCRAILDHIPPIFNETNFNSIAPHTRQGDSLKKVASHLDSSLTNIANNHIHKQISNKEMLPSPEEIDFKADINFLLGRIIEKLG